MVGCSDQSDVEASGGLVILFHAAGVAPGCKRGVEHGNAIVEAVYAHRQVFGVSVCDLLQARNMVKLGGFTAARASIMARQKTAASNQRVSIPARHAKAAFVKKGRHNKLSNKIDPLLFENACLVGLDRPVHRQIRAEVTIYIGN